MSNIVKLSKNNYKFNNNINTLSEDNQIKYDEYNKFVEDSKKNLNLIVKNCNNLINVINYLIDQIKKESILKIEKNSNLNNLPKVYKNLQETFIAFKDNKTNFEKLEGDYNRVKQSIIDKKTELTSIIAEKNKINNTFATSKFYEIKNSFTKIIKKVELIIKNIKQDFDNKNKELNTLLADAKYNLLDSVMNYFTAKINEISNISLYKIDDKNTNEVILSKLKAMKNVQSKINEYILQLKNFINNSSINNFPPINENKTEEFNKKYDDIQTKYKEITKILSDSIENFKNKTLKDITELQTKILDLINQIKKLVSDFKLKHDIFKDENFKNITLQINSLTNATNSKKYMDKLDEILKNLTKGLNNKTSNVNAVSSLNNNTSYVNAGSSLTSNNVRFNSVYESNNNNMKFVNNPSLSSSSFTSKLGNRVINNNNARSELTQNNNVEKPLVKRNTQNKYNYVKARNNVLGYNEKQLAVNSPIAKLFNPETEIQKVNSKNNLKVEVNNKTKQEIISKMNNLTEKALEKKKEINKKYGNNQTKKIQKSTELRNLRSKLASNLTILTTKNGSQIKNESLINKKKNILNKI